MENKLKINWTEVGKLALASIIIFTIKYILVNFVKVEFRANETLSMGGVILGIVFVSMILEYLKGFTIIGKGDGKGASIILGIGSGIFSDSLILLIITTIVVAAIFAILNGMLESKREKARLEKAEKKKMNKKKKKKRK